jgi:hypothetical protein
MITFRTLASRTLGQFARCHAYLLAQIGTPNNRRCYVEAFQAITLPEA